MADDKKTSRVRINLGGKKTQPTQPPATPGTSRVRINLGDRKPAK